MTGSRALFAVPVVVAVVLGLAGCRGGEWAASPGPAVSSPSAASSPHGSGRVTAPDPLAGVEATVDAIAHDVDSDAGSDAGTGR